MQPLIRDATAADHARILALNDAEVQHTSAMDPARLQQLAQWACRHRVACVDGEVAAFLLALREGTSYDSPNYRGFAARLQRFVYVDRVVVDARFAGRGIGRALYEDLFSYAQEQRLGHVTCEYNLEPPNPASKAFHDRFGFREIGTQLVDGGRKRVSLQVATV